LTDVSCLIPSGLIPVCRSRGLPVEAALADLPVPISVLENRRSEIAWEHFARVMDTLEDLAGGPPDGMASLVREMEGPRGALTRIFRFAVTPRQLYQLMARFTGPRAFPTHDGSFEVLPGERYRIEIEIVEGERGCAAFFRGCAAYFEFAPRMIGLGDALVEAEIEPRRASFVITPPPSPSIWSRLSRIYDLFRHSEAVVDELRERHEDLTLQRAALRGARLELTDSERRFADVFHASAIPMVVSPVDGGHALDANAAFLEKAGLSTEELFSTPIEELPLWSSVEEGARIRSLLRSTSLSGIDVELLDRDGRQRRGLLSSSVSRHAGQSVSLIQVVDVTDHDELQSRQQQSQKMELVGQLAGGVAHDFNNLLTVITLYSEEQLADLEPATSPHVAAEAIHRAAERASKLTTQLLAFARKQVLHPSRVDLNERVHDVLDMLRRLIGENVTINSELTNGLAPVRADPVQIEQVVLNLALNARDAMPHGGELRIATRPATAADLAAARGPLPTAERDDAAPFDESPSDYVALTVSDTGTGMDSAVLERIFEPFFSTKERDKGTGLGLSTVEGIVFQSGGRLQVESTRGEGTCFTALLPAAHGVAEPLPATPGTRGAGTGAGRTLLLAEDEDQVRGAVIAQLERSGYRVLAASCGAEAREIAASHAGPLHALITDLVMPGMTGTELAEEMQRRRPGLPTMFISGHSLDQPDEDRATVLRKPFRIVDLEAHLRTILEPAGRS
jgi:PAS domain S-box-containing protein